jgi:hypothetical protein
VWTGIVTRLQTTVPPWTLVFVYNLAIIAVLVVLAVWSVDGTIFPAWLPNRYRLPLHCVWFGALGGIVISLKGVYEHSGRTPPNAWDDRFNLWHLGRPFSGGITGLMTYFLLLALNSGGKLSAPVAYAGAFILGTQERRFFNFLYQVARLILQVPNDPPDDAFSLIEIQPRQGRANDVLVVRGTGFSTGLVVRLDGSPLANLVVSSDGTAAAGVVPAHMPGPVGVTIVDPAGNSAVREAAFIYLPAPGP